MRALQSIVILLIALGGITCGGSSDGVEPTFTPSPTEVSTFANYINESHGFSLMYPADWEIDEMVCIECHGPLVAIEAPQTCGNLITRIDIKKDELTEIMSIEDYFDYKERDLLSGLDDYVPLSKHVTTAGGREAMRHEFTYTASGQTVYIIATILLDNYTGWYLYCTCAESCSSKCEAVFDTMAGSFNVIE